MRGQPPQRLRLRFDTALRRQNQVWPVPTTLRTISDLYAAVAEAFKLRTRFPDGLRLSLVGGDRLLPGLPLDAYEIVLQCGPLPPLDGADRWARERYSERAVRPAVIELVERYGKQARG